MGEILLTNFENVFTIGELEICSGEVFGERKSNLDTECFPLTFGMYNNFEGRTVSIYRRDQVLYLNFLGDEVPFQDISVLHEIGSAGQRSLAISHRGIVLLNVEYEVFDLSSIFNPTLAEQEDYDFGEFLSILAKDSERQAGIFLEGYRFSKPEKTSWFGVLGVLRWWR